MTGALPAPRVLALSGGVGGAKLALGLSRVLPPDDLVIVANTGDDFEHLGLHVAPDIDSLVYALAGLNDTARGWGRADESWNFLAALRDLGGPDWFRLGDRDLAMHVARTERLRGGESLSAITASLARLLGIAHAIVPMCDRPVRTMVLTAAGELPFQRYFVAEHCAPRVLGFRFDGAAAARPSAAFAAALASPRLDCVVLCPSNPFISIDPILAIPGVRAALAALTAPIVAVSPIVGGRAVKGPAGKMLEELGHEISALGVARYYADLLDGFVLDAQDAPDLPAVRALGLAAGIERTIMHSVEDKIALAAAVLRFAAGLRIDAAA